MFSSSKSFSGSHWFGSFCKVRPPSENFRSHNGLLPRKKKKKHIMPEAHPHPQDNIWTPSLHWFLQLALVSATSPLTVCFSYLPALAILNLQSPTHFLLFPAPVFCSCCSSAWNGLPVSATWQVLILSCTRWKHHLFYNLHNYARQTLAFTLSSLCPKASSPVLYCIVTVSFPRHCEFPEGRNWAFQICNLLCSMGPVFFENFFF